MRREVALALAEVRLIVTARPAVRSGGHSFAESEIFGGPSPRVKYLALIEEETFAESEIFGSR
jgi:hypothetical protein